MTEGYVTLQELLDRCRELGLIKSYEEVGAEVEIRQGEEAPVTLSHDRAYRYLQGMLQALRDVGAFPPSKK